MKKLLVLICIIFNSANVFAQVDVTAAEAKNHTDQVITVCDRIVDAKYLESSMTKPTLLNVGGAYPNHLLTIVINYEDRKNFPFNPEEFYLSKRVCVTGRVTDFKGKPQIIVLTPAEIKVDASQAGANKRSSDGTTTRTASTNPSNTTNPSNWPSNSNSKTSTTNPVTSTNRGTTTPPTSLGNQTSTTNPVTSTNRGTTTPPTSSGNQTSTISSGTSANQGNTTNPTGSTNQTSTTSPVTSTNRTATNPTNNTNRSVTDNKSSSAYSIEVEPNLRVRSGPGENFGVIEVTKAGSEVTVLGSENGWSHVTYEKDSAEQGQPTTVEGYIKNSVLNSTATSNAISTTAAASIPAKKASSADAKTINSDANKKTAVNSKNPDAYSIKISANLKVRSAPSDDGDVIEVIKAGTVVSVISSRNGWSSVSYQGGSSSGYTKGQMQKGFIKNSVLK